MKTIEINTSNGRLEADLYSSSSEKLVILCHGFCSNKDKEKNKITAEKLSKAGFNVLAINFGGSGNSYETELDIDKQIEDLKSAIEFIKSKSYNRIGLIEDSLFGLIVLKSYPCFKEDIKTICLWAPVSKYRSRDLFYERYENSEKEMLEKGFYLREKDGKTFKIPLRLLESQEKVNQDELLLGIDCPILFVHGDEDEQVSIHDSEEAVKKIKKAELRVIDGLTHNFKNFEKELSEITLNWFKRNL